MSEQYSYSSPDGRYGFAIHAWEARMSHWIQTPSLIDLHTKASLLAFKGNNWSLDRATWESPTVVHLEMRKYPGDHTPPAFQVILDCGSRMAQVDDAENVSLAKVEEILEMFYRKGRRT